MHLMGPKFDVCNGPEVTFNEMYPPLGYKLWQVTDSNDNLMLLLSPDPQ
jgi:hypothetical protein